MKGYTRIHRCKGSLEDFMNIRYGKPSWEKEDKWWLLKDKEDYDYMCQYLQPITKIKYCPFCGEELK